jgi:hypothetical protein
MAEGGVVGRVKRLKLRNQVKGSLMLAVRGSTRGSYVHYPCRGVHSALSCRDFQLPEAQESELRLEDHWQTAMRLPLADSTIFDWSFAR